MEMILIILAVVAASAALFSFVALGKVKAANQKAESVEAARQSLESKLNGVRQEISSLKDDNQRKTKALDEARDNAKKRLRKDAQKSDSEGADDASSDSEIDRLKRTLAAMESQIRTMKESSEQSVVAATSAIEAAHSKELAKLKNEIESLEDQVSQAKGETNKRRQNLSKQLATPVDLAALPTEVVGELARLMRKTEQHEKMHGILQGKHQLAQERYQELQRRYFAVCRELALVALPKAETSDEDARQLAESVVEASDSLSMQKEKSEAMKQAAAEEPSHEAGN